MKTNDIWNTPGLEMGSLFVMFSKTDLLNGGPAEVVSDEHTLEK